MQQQQGMQKFLPDGASQHHSTILSGSAPAVPAVQLGLPVDVSVAEIVRKASLGAAIDLCLEVAGVSPKALQADLKLDKAQYSRWTSGQEGITWHKLAAVMDRCGNDVPLLWMAHQRQYDLHSMHKFETELERQNRLLRDENAALRRVLQGGRA